MIWPAHCVFDTWGALSHPDLVVGPQDFQIIKGSYKNIQSYSAFGESKEDTGLANILSENDILNVYVVGNTFDYSIGYTAKQSASLGYKTYIFKGLCGTLQEKSEDLMVDHLQDSGVTIVASQEDLEMFIQDQQRATAEFAESKKVRIETGLTSDLMGDDTKATQNPFTSTFTHA